MKERDIFGKALEYSDPSSRKAFLDNSCEGDAALRARIEALLVAHENASQFLDQPAAEQLKPTNSGGQLAQTIDSAVRDGRNSSRADEDSDNDGANDLDLSFLQPSSQPDSIGRLGHYEVLQVLGTGAFGIVFKAFDEKLHRLVAIKAMNPQIAATSPPRKRFLREARSVAAIKHENIVQVYSVEEQPLPYLVMEYIDGQTLQDRLDGSGPLDVSEILDLGRQMASGLAAAHALGLIHRDIKPGNILLERGAASRVKITDFGLARAADDASITQSGIISGTPLYMSPEQAQGHSLDHRSDLFSLGSVLYQMASGRPPFRAASALAVLKRVADDTPRPIQEIIPEVPQWLCSIIAKLHDKDRNERFQSATDVVEEIARCQSEFENTGEAVGVSAMSRGKDHVQSTGAKTVAASVESTARHTPLRSRPAVWIFLGILVVVGANGAAPYLVQWMTPEIPNLPEGFVSGGLNFDGKDDYVKVGAIDWSYPQFTIEAFVTSANNSDNGTIVSLSSMGKDGEWMVLYDGGQAGPGKRTSGAQIKGETPIVTAYGPLTPNVRQHRAMVFDGAKLHYYINGIWQGERRAAAHEGMMWKMRELRLGCGGDGRRFFQGRIDQVRISKVARYPDSFPPIARVDSDDVTLALYNFDEGRGDTLADASGHGHDAKIFGATWVSQKPPSK
ncbi:MAG: protein kinase [Planctomycetaceae bacterium]|nr:protein kinase [Planctomycetales bacterium]MCB9921729.1 protein kinase [Planctomycetaceae bacterium]